MELVLEWLKAFAADIWSAIKHIGYVDVLDILFVTVLFYFVYKFIRTRRAGKLALGVAVFILLLILTSALEMQAAQFLMKNVIQIGLVTVIVVFQPELRAALEVLGNRVKAFGDIQKDSLDLKPMIAQLTEAVDDMSRDKTGALIVIERMTALGDQIITGTVLNADVQCELVKNIFFNKAPLHDGAMIIRNSRIHAAGCILPLTSRTDLTKDLGMRHRAALGLSENSDALIIVVSEETGTVSLVEDGEIKRGFSSNELKHELEDILIGSDDAQKMSVIRRVKETTSRKHHAPSRGKKNVIGNGEGDADSAKAAESRSSDKAEKQ